MKYSSAWWLFEPTPLKKIRVNVNWDDDIPNISGKKTCSKPPTSLLLLLLHIRGWYFLFGAREVVGEPTETGQHQPVKPGEVS